MGTPTTSKFGTSRGVAGLPSSAAELPELLGTENPPRCPEPTSLAGITWKTWHRVCRQRTWPWAKAEQEAKPGACLFRWRCNSGIRPYNLASVRKTNMPKHNVQTPLPSLSMIPRRQAPSTPPRPLGVVYFFCTLQLYRQSTAKTPQLQYFFRLFLDFFHLCRIDLRLGRPLQKPKKI